MASTGESTRGFPIVLVLKVNGVQSLEPIKLYVVENSIITIDLPIILVVDPNEKATLTGGIE